MMKRSALLPVSALVVLALVGIAPSIPAQKSYALAVSGGAAIPTGKFSEAQSTGYAVTAFLALGVPDLPLGVRFDGIYNNFLGRTVTAVAGGNTRNPHVRVMGVLGNLIYSFPGSSAKPYVVTGAGIYNVKAEAPGVRSKSDFGYSAGFGSTFGVGPVAAFIEARYHGVSRDTADGGNIQFVPITLGIVF
jgi:hypothetical protein